MRNGALLVGVVGLAAVAWGLMADVKALFGKRGLPVN